MTDQSFGPCDFCHWEGPLIIFTDNPERSPWHVCNACFWRVESLASRWPLDDKFRYSLGCQNCNTILKQTRELTAREAIAFGLFGLLDLCKDRCSTCSAQPTDRRYVFLDQLQCDSKTIKSISIGDLLGANIPMEFIKEPATQ